MKRLIAAAAVSSVLVAGCMDDDFGDSGVPIGRGALCEWRLTHTAAVDVEVVGRGAINRKCVAGPADQDVYDAADELIDARLEALE